MANPFAPKPKTEPPPGAPKRVVVTNVGAIHQMIVNGSKLFRLGDHRHEAAFDYRIWISEYHETHVFALIPDLGDVHIGELLEGSDGYLTFVRDANGPRESDSATTLFARFWNAIERACKLPTTMEFSYYD